MPRRKSRRKKRRDGEGDFWDGIEEWHDPQQELGNPEQDPEPDSEPEREAEPEPEPEAELDRAGSDNRPFGPRRAALEQRRRRRKRSIVRTTLALLLALLVGGGAVAAVVLFSGSDDATGSGSTHPRGSADPPSTVTTTLVVGTSEKDPNAGALWLALLYIDRTGDKGAVVYIPPHTAAQVPGRGLLGLGDSLASGGMPLLLLSAQNLLGVPIDHYIELSDQSAQVLFDHIGPLTVDVPNDITVPVGHKEQRVIVAAGRQSLAPEFLVKFLYVAGTGGDDIELGSRQIAFWTALFDRFADDPGALETDVRDASTALVTDSTASEEASLFKDLASLSLEQRTIAVLPVKPVSAGGEALYEADPGEVASFVHDTFAALPPAQNEVRVQVLNGNGVPGIGEEVAKRLVGHGFRVILGGNAPRLDYEKTRIVTYSDTPGGLAQAQRAKELLGVGEVQVSAQPQGIVDLTIVVGKDFLRTR
ncbi:MAG: LCP family protein [Actinomycetota bacterium]